MTLEQKLVLKMEPHAKRIVDGSGNDFDYLPAVLLQLMEQQKRLALQFDNNAELIKEIASKVSAAELSNKAQIATVDDTVKGNAEHLGTKVTDAQDSLHKAITRVGEPIGEIAKRQATQTDLLNAISGLTATTSVESKTQFLTLESSLNEKHARLGSDIQEIEAQRQSAQTGLINQLQYIQDSTQQQQGKLLKMLIVSLLANAALVCLAVVILMRQ